MIAKWYGLAAQSMLNKEIDVDSDTLKLMLVTTGYSFNQDTHRYKSSITNEVSGSGYTAGGATLSGVSVSYNTSTNVLSFDANDVSWDPVTLTGANAAAGAVLYNSSPGSDATRPLLIYIDFEDTFEPQGGELTIEWAAGGIGAVTVS